MKKLVLPLLFSLLGVAHAQSANAEIEKVVSAVCQKQVVLLGEDSNHGSGETLKVKVELINRLVNRCGFFGDLFRKSTI
jgi:erythromycin esterase-like protein